MWILRPSPELARVAWLKIYEYCKELKIFSFKYMHEINIQIFVNTFTCAVIPEYHNS